MKSFFYDLGILLFGSLIGIVILIFILRTVQITHNPTAIKTVDTLAVLLGVISLAAKKYAPPSVGKLLEIVSIAAPASVLFAEVVQSVVC
jgi:hypothetical protein